MQPNHSSFSAVSDDIVARGWPVGYELTNRSSCLLSLSDSESGNSTSVSTLDFCLGRWEIVMLELGRALVLGFFFRSACMALANNASSGSGSKRNGRLECVGQRSSRASAWAFGLLSHSNPSPCTAT